MLNRVIRLTQPVSEPASLSEVKENLRLPSSQTIDDVLITSYISAARQQAEEFIDRPICESDFVVVIDSVAASRLCIKYPASAVSSVTYRDASDDEQSATFSYDAQLNTVFFDDYIEGKDLKVTITSGISSDYPQSLKQAVIMLACDLYTGRASAEYHNKAAIMMMMPFKNQPIL
jgi:uncharacterized phiE125 gp8 family phage protein